MRATLVCFPGGEHPIVHEGRTLLRDILRLAGVSFNTTETAVLAINGTVTSNLDAEVPDGAIVTKTAHVEGA